MNSPELHLDLERRTANHVQYVGELVDGSDEWHAHRNDGIGASTAPVVMGMSPFKSAIEEWAERTGKKDPEIPSPDRQEVFTLGHCLEYAAEARFKIMFPDLEVFDTGSWRNKARPWQTSNPDRVYYDQARDVFGLIEIKSSGHGVGWRSNTPPIYYLTQVRYQLSTLGLEEGVLFCIIGNSETIAYRIYLDPEKAIVNLRTGERVYERTVTEAVMIQCCEGFLNCVEQDTPPRIDGSVSAWRTVTNISPDADKSLTYDTGQDVRDDLVSKYRAKEAATEAYNQARAQLFSDMGDASKARYVSGDGTRYPFATKRKGPGGRYTLYLTDK
jgi:putative phage-type endonuclease